MRIQVYFLTLKFFPLEDKLAGESGVRVTWLGHATVLAEVDRAVILCDPIFSDRCSPVQVHTVIMFYYQPVSSRQEVIEFTDK